MAINPDKTVAYFVNKLGAYPPVDEPKIRAAVERINEIFSDAVGRVGKIPVSTIIWFSAGGVNYGCRIDNLVFYFDIRDNGKEISPPWVFDTSTGELQLDTLITPYSICYRAPKVVGKKKGKQIQEEQEAAKDEEEVMKDGMLISNKKVSGGMF